MVKLNRDSKAVTRTVVLYSGGMMVTMQFYRDSKAVARTVVLCSGGMMVTMQFFGGCEVVE